MDKFHFRTQPESLLEGNLSSRFLTSCQSCRLAIENNLSNLLGTKKLLRVPGLSTRRNVRY